MEENMHNPPEEVANNHGQPARRVLASYTISDLETVRNNCQYRGSVTEDLNQHLSVFLRICDTVKTNGVHPAIYKLLLFPFSLRDKATQWLEIFPKESITNWDDLVSKFLDKFYPPQRNIKLKTDVQTFRQLEGESLYEAWERYKALIRRCPPDMFSEWVKLQNFYEGLSMKARKALDYSSGVSLQMMKTSQEAHDLIDMVVNNQYFYSSERQAAPKRGVCEVEDVDAILAQNKLMHQQLQQQMEMMLKRMAGLQLAVVSITNQPLTIWGQHEESYEVCNNEQQPEQNQEMANKNYEASMRNLERQIGQLSKQPIERPSKTFPSDTIPNPKKECKAIQLRSRKTLGDDTKVSSKEQTGVDKNDKKDSKKDEEPQTSTKGKQLSEAQPQEQRKEVKPYVPPLPYPQRLHKELKDQQFPKFLEIFKKLEINLPLAEALEQMPDVGIFSSKEKLAIEEVKPTRMSLQMADRSLKIPNGIVKNLLVKIGEFIFPADFVILDMEEEGHNSIILGQPFLSTARAIIDVKKGKMVLRVHNDKMIINVFNAMQ
ncbi:uncharacterized protein LOC107640823 [Arachis ipaensis]|uniref:uncharacterized protein LOC107640823 n=1 Tax=Arachis ipaensis TaxID=130454 RepID=UPI0007AF0E9A|nr:uncharacterized protein LOC107640823 [Arachis ipaensis]